MDKTRLKKPTPIDIPIHQDLRAVLLAVPVESREGFVHQSRGGVPTGVLSIATRYIHSGSEICSLTDAEQCARLLAKVVGA